VCGAYEADVEGALNLVRIFYQHVVLGFADPMGTAAFAESGSAPARTLSLEVRRLPPSLVFAR
jgi:hypothetical protein